MSNQDKNQRTGLYRWRAAIVLVGLIALLLTGCVTTGSTYSRSNSTAPPVVVDRMVGPW
jgi:type IV secretory pathway TrbF-like protein